MQKLVDGLILYHGSYCEVRNPQLEKCAKRKDFILQRRENRQSVFLKQHLSKQKMAGL